MKNRGFSFIELVMIILIVGIVAAVATSSMHVPSIMRLEAAKNKILHDIRYAQNMAITQQTYFGIQFDTINEQYTLYSGDYPGITSGIVDPVNGQAYTVNFVSDPRFRGINLNVTTLTNQILEFDKWGIPYEGSGVLSANRTISISDPVSGRTITITIYVNTGLVR